MKRSRVGRMLQILTALQSGRNNRVDDLAEMYTLSKRTIFRDLKELKEIGISCRYNTKTNSYSTEPGFFLTPTNPNRKEAMGVLLLNRIKELNRLDKGFVKDEDFDINEYLGKAWSLIPEGRLYHVKLRFSPEVAHNVAEVNWHRTQRVTFEDDGSAIVQFRIDGLEEITWWILGYGDKVQVLAPLTLRQRIVQIAQKMVQTNQLASLPLQRSGQELPLRNANPFEA